MEKQGYLTREERLAAEATSLSFNPSPYPIEAPHLIWIIKDQIDKLTLEGVLDSHESLVVRTTLDLDYQYLAESTLKRRIESFKNENNGISHNVNNGAVVVLDPQNGEILALVGSADYFDESIHGAVDMASSPRQTGSAFKPFIYALALDPTRPDAWTASTSILDVSTTFLTKEGAPYTPVNYDGREHGLVSVRESLGSSLNIPAVKTLQEVGIEKAIDLAGRLGITSLRDPGQYDLSLALGGGQVSLLQLSTAYASFANQGYFTGNYSILDIHNADGKLLYEQEKNSPVQVFDSRVAWLINDILSDDSARLTGFGPDSTLKLDRAAAVKTGTTTNFHDNWTVGYTPDLLVGVWVGNSGYEAMHNVTGLTGAAPIWHELMRGLSQGHPDRPFERPDGLTQAEVCSLSGLLPTSACSGTRLEWFIAGTEPTRTDTFHQQVWIDMLTNSLADDSTPMERRKAIVVLDLPVEVQTWAHKHGLPLLTDYVQADGSPSGALNQLVLLSPHPNTTYRIDQRFDPSAQQLQIAVAVSEGFSDVTIWVDGNPWGTLSSAPYQAWWGLSMGEHQFWAQGIDANGKLTKTEVVTIRVVDD
jgi:membrane carboxypeptidase/penicillin-binding protein PbpC